MMQDYLYFNEKICLKNKHTVTIIRVKRLLLMRIIFLIERLIIYDKIERIL